MRPGTTLIEQLLVLSLVGLLLAVAVPSALAQVDRTTTRLARQQAADVFAAARDLAVARGAPVAVRIDAGGGRLVAHAGADTLRVAPLGAVHRVALAATRDSMAYGGNGLGVGAANLRLIVRRRRAADTLTVSRLGRVSR